MNEATAILLLAIAADFLWNAIPKKRASWS